MFRALGRRAARIISKSSFRDWRNDGTPEILLSIVFAVFAYDRYLQCRREDDRAARRAQEVRALLLDQGSDENGDEGNLRGKNFTPVPSASKGDDVGLLASVASTEIMSVPVKDKVVLLDRLEDVEWKARQKLWSENAEKPSIFSCVVRRIPKHHNAFDGRMCLTGLTMGEKVEVLEEGVGPGGMYNLCRAGVQGSLDDGKSRPVRVGWYPISFLEKLQSK